MRFCFTLPAAILLTLGFTTAGAAQQVTKQQVEGVTNFVRLETTIACAGATKASAVPELKKMGFASIINLRQASETGAEVEAEGEAAKAAGITYIHIPMNGAAPDVAVADKFIAAVTTPANMPAFIHCAGGNRAASMWFLKRLVVDKWDVDRASKEAAALGMTSEALKNFGIEYAKTHQR